MEDVSLIIGISGIIILLINGINYSVKQFGSDHYFHQNLIALIKENKHSLVTNYKNFIGSKSIAYPQLLHWLFSFFSLKNISKTVFIYKSLVYFLDVAFFLLFFYSDLVSFKSSLPYFQTFSYAALLFIFTPFNYVRWNATNAGFSPRSLGVLLGRVFVYGFLFFIKMQNWLVYAGLIIVALLIFLGSQFALQYILFLCLVYGFIALNFLIVAIPFIAYLLFYLLNKKVAVAFIKGQYQHKKTYATFFAKRFILKYRPSIWRDFVYDFWIKLRKEKGNALPYIQYNAVVTIFWGFTILPAILFYFIKVKGFTSIAAFTNTLAQYPLLQIVLITLLLFFLTSFAATRFLGEPERYLEFAMPVMVVLFMQCFSSTIIYYTIIYYVIASFLLLLINKWYNKKTAADKNPIWQLSGDSEIKKALAKLKEEKGELRIFSNNEEVCRMLLSAEYSFLIPDIAAEKTGSFYYKDIFNEQYPYVNERLIGKMIEEFGVNVIVVEKGFELPKQYFHSTQIGLSTNSFSIFFAKQL